MATILLLRHGVTDWNEERRIQGWGPIPLNETGREQAAAAGSHLASKYDVDRVVVSDLQRCVETAEEVTARVEAPTSTTRDWRERGFGIYQGLLYEEVFERHPEHDATSGIVTLDATPENGESMLDLQDRVLSGWERLVNEIGDEETVLVVTHGGPIYVTLGHVRGKSLVQAIAEGSQDNCALNELQYDSDEGETEVVFENFTGYRDEVEG